MRERERQTDREKEEEEKEEEEIESTDSLCWIDEFRVTRCP